MIISHLKSPLGDLGVNNLEPHLIQSIRNILHEGVALNLGAFREQAFHIKAFARLDEFEMDRVARDEGLQVLRTDHTGLIFKVFRLGEDKLGTARENAGRETVEKVAVSPFAFESLGIFDGINEDLENLVGNGLYLDDFLVDELLGGVVARFHVEPMEAVVVAFPNGGEVYADAGRVVDDGTVIALDGAIELFDVVLGVFLFFLGKTEGGKEAERHYEDVSCFHCLVF